MGAGDWICVAVGGGAVLVLLGVVTWALFQSAGEE